MTEKDAQKHLSIVMLFANILAGVSCMTIGVLADRVKVFKVLCFNNIFVSFMLLAMVIQLNQGI